MIVQTSIFLLQEKRMLVWTNRILPVKNYQQRLCPRRTFNLPRSLDENIIAEVKELLCKLGILLYGSKIQEFSRALEPLLEGIGQGFQQKKTDQLELEEKTLCCDQLLDEVAAFKVKVEVFRQEIPTNQQRVAEIDSTIAKYKA